MPQVGVLCLDLIWGLDVQVAKCCQEPQVLDTESGCILPIGWHDQETESKTLGQVTGVDLRAQSSGARHVSLNLSTDGLESVLRQPECEGWEAEYTEIGADNGTAWLTQTGQLLLEDGQYQYLYHDFCVDRTPTGKLVAETCPTCTKEQPCLHLCCPHGQALVIDEQSGEKVCNDQKPRRDDQNEVFWKANESQMDKWQLRHKFIFRAPIHAPGFQCPKGQNMDVVHSNPDFPRIIDKFEVGVDERLYGMNLRFSEFYLDSYW